MLSHAYIKNSRSNSTSHGVPTISVEVKCLSHSSSNLCKGDQTCDIDSILGENGTVANSDRGESGTKERRIPGVVTTAAIGNPLAMPFAIVTAC